MLNDYISLANFQNEKFVRVYAELCKSVINRMISSITLAYMILYVIWFLLYELIL